MGSFAGRKLVSLISVAIVAAMTLSACHKKEDRVKLVDMVEAEPIKADSVVGHWRESGGGQDIYFSALDGSGSGDITFVDERGPFLHKYTIVSNGDDGRSLRIQTVSTKNGYTSTDTFAVGKHGKILYRDDEIGTAAGPIVMEYVYEDDKTHP